MDVSVLPASIEGVYFVFGIFFIDLAPYRVFC